MNSKMRIKLFLISLSCLLVSAVVPRSQAQDAPRFKVDPYWPKELPNNWILQGVPRIAIDKNDHVWIISRESDINTTAQLDAPENGAGQDPPTAMCCKAAPAVLEFDAEGNLLKAWGAPTMCPAGLKDESTPCWWTSKGTSG